MTYRKIAKRLLTASERAHRRSLLHQLSAYDPKSLQHWLSLSMAARELNMPRPTLVHWCKTGRIRSQRLGPHTFIHRKEVDKCKQPKGSSSPSSSS